MTELDYKNEIDNAIRNDRIEIAKKLIKNGITLEQIKNTFDLDEFAIKKIHDDIGNLTDDEIIRIHQSREMAEFDYNSMISHAKNSVKIEAAKKLLKYDYKLEFIKSVTNLDETTIKKLQSELDREY